MFGISNGEEKDKAWGWKGEQEKWSGVVHEKGLLSHKDVSKTELRELFARSGGGGGGGDESNESESKAQAKL